MDREQTIEAIKVMQAWVDGEVVQCYWADEWHDMPHDDMNWSLYTHAYRIKPRPMRKYVVIEYDGSANTYESKLEADEAHDYSLAKWHGWMVEEPK